ncbi:sugar ABC transporter ATP-binding protein [Terriglobus sp. 2YAB30_2]|uniref:sugar ABC transporter ATP-binding protein n=3 Tax=unclassified Terriglobus TaxID=2628988 RepID=UPI003F9C8BAA
MSDVILQANGILKRYPGNIALDHVDFRLHRNAVNVLIGENGAGKSTLMRILSGVESCDEGTILLDGKPITLRSPRDAGAHGISIVHQELSVMPNLDISENIFAGRELTRVAMVDRKTEDSQSADALHRLHKPMPVSAQTAHLSLGCRQIVELARTIAHGSKILILDEPTSALSMAEAESLFEVIEDLKRSGVTIVYISHRLHELLHLGDYFTVLRSGRVVGEAPRSEVTRQWIVERMSGRADTTDLQVRPAASTQAVLSVHHLELGSSSAGEESQAALHEISFTLHKGEVLGIYGLLGAGRTELLETLAGNRTPLEGSVQIEGRTLALNSVGSAVKAGIVLVPEDRQRDGLIPELSIRENVALAASHGPLLSRAHETELVRKLAKDLNIAANDLELPVTSLSGGNQQKVLIARCLMRNPRVLLLDEPTRGVDAGAKAEIYRILRKLAANGLSILFTSSEIEETRTLADRALVLCQGRIAAEFQHHQLTDEALFAAASPNVTTGSIA